MKTTDSPNSTRLMVVTDIPFWQCLNGSHVRVSQLLRALADADIDLHVWHLGQVDLGSRRRIRDALPGVRLSFMQIPWLDSIGQWVDRRQWVDRQRDKPADDGNELPAQIPSLGEFEVAGIARRFRRQLDRIRPSAVLIEYLSLGYLARIARDHDPTVITLVDTHDVLSQRDQHFERQGWGRWLRITPEEERDALRDFDVVIAIQPNDASTFQEWLPESKVITTGHSPQVSRDNEARSTPADAPELTGVVGMIGGLGDANVASVKWFMTQVWPRVHQAWTKLRASRPFPQLILAGAMCEDDDISSLANQAGVEVLGRTNSTADFYRRIDIAVNPVWIESGLKIKSVEAIAAGCPLVTTRAGAAGLEKLIDSSVKIGDDADTFASNLVNWLADPVELRSAASAAQDYAREQLSPDAVYGELLDCLAKQGIKRGDVGR